MKNIKNLTPLERAKLWYQENKNRPEFQEKQKVRLSIWRKNFPREYLIQRAKQRSKQFNLEFNLVPEDIIIPSECPVLKVPLKVGTRYAASLDRIDPTKGYTKTNIQVISRKANLMKQDASLEELRKFAEWVNQYLI